MLLASPADQADEGPVFVGHHRPPVVLLFVHQAVVMEGAGNFIGLHEGDLRKAPPARTTDQLEDSGHWIGCAILAPHSQPIQTRPPSPRRLTRHSGGALGGKRLARTGPPTWGAMLSLVSPALSRDLSVPGQTKLPG